MESEIVWAIRLVMGPALDMETTAAKNKQEVTETIILILGKLKVCVEQRRKWEKKKIKSEKYLVRDDGFKKERFFIVRCSYI